MPDTRRPARKELEEFWVVNNFLSLRVLQKWRKGLQRLARLVHPNGPAFSCLRRNLHRCDARPESLRVACASFKIQPDRQPLFGGKYAEVFPALGYAGQLGEVRISRLIGVRRRRGRRIT